MRVHWHAGLAFFCLGTLVLVGGEPGVPDGYAGRAVLPYHYLYHSAKVLSAGKEPGKIVFSMGSKRPGVSPKDIVLYIDAKGGRIPLPVSNTGSVELPTNPALIEEDPWIVSNQPKGTMTATVMLAMESPSPDDVEAMQKGRLKYRFLMTVLEIMARAYREFPADMRAELHGTAATGTRMERIPLRVREVSGNAHIQKEYLLEPGDEGQLRFTVHAQDGDLILAPDGDGVLRIPDDSRLREEDPWVSVPPDLVRTSGLLPAKAPPESPNDAPAPKP